MDDEKLRVIWAFLVASIIGIFVGALRGVVQEKYSDWKLLFRGICASVLVAIFVGLALEDTQFSYTMKLTIIGISSFVADDILMGLLALSRIFGSDPLAFIFRLLDAYRGNIKSFPTTKEDKEKGAEK